MGLQRTLFRAANKLLAPANLLITRSEKDFDARLDDPAQIARMHRAFAAAIREWLSNQTTVPVRAEIDAEREAASFYDAYMNSDYREQTGGSRYNNLLFLYVIGKVAAPSLVVDSGTYTGGSAWAFSLACPKARILSFDIDLSRLRRRMTGVEYMQRDWTTFDFGELSTADGLCYFDDHLDQARRLLEAAERGFRLAIFDDDFPLTSFAPMAGDGSALPKIEFVLDEQLRGEDQVSWVANGQKRSWKVDRAYLDRARRVIAATERLPNTSHITGIHQTPYRLVAIHPAPGLPA